MFHPVGSKNIVLPGSQFGIAGSMQFGETPQGTVIAPVIDLVSAGAAPAPETVTFANPYTGAAGAQWVHVQVTVNEDLTGLTFVGSGGATFAYPGALTYASLNAGQNVLATTASYFAFNVTGATLNTPLIFTATANEGEVVFEIAVV